jgi:alkylation response protein AidB-like acyl-CoA dehydrogenase
MIVADHPVLPATAFDDVAALLLRVRQVAERCAASAAARDVDGAFPAAEFRDLAAAGALAAPLPRRLGGLGLGTEPGGAAALLRLFELLGWGSLPVGRLFEGHANALILIAAFGTAEQAARAAADVRDHGRVFAVWNTEGADGVRIAPGPGGRFRLSGAKLFASGAGSVERPLLTAAWPDGGWQMVVLPSERLDPPPTIDRSWWAPLGMRASASHRMAFDGVEVGPEDLVGEPGDYYRQPWFGAGAVRFAAVQLGGAAAVLDAGRRDLVERRRVDDAFQQARFGAAAVALEGGRGWLHGFARLADRSPFGGVARDAIGGPDAVADDALLAYANLARTGIERACLDILEAMERGVGSRGMLAPHPLERLGRDLTTYLRQPAPDAALADAGRYVLDSPRSAVDRWDDGEGNR